MASIVRPSQEGSFFKPPRQFKNRGPSGFPIGKRTKRRQKENRELNKSNIRYCEIRIPGICAGSAMLTWAHSKKSRFLVTSKDWQEAARACLPCHMAAEAMSHAKMKKLITEAIKKRARRRIESTCQP